MSDLKSHTDLIQDLLNLHPYHNVLVPCVCCSGHPYPPKKDCEYCEGTGKIMYGLADVEVI